MNARQRTIKNLAIVDEFVLAGKDIADSILLTGSNSWGPFCAVNKNSDIDLVIITKTIKQIEKIIEQFVYAQLLDQNEKQRFSIFYKLYKEKKVDYFSTCHFYKNTAISIDFILLKFVKRICRLKPIQLSKQKNIGKIKIRYVREFRATPPRITGYSLDNLNKTQQVSYHPKFQEIKDTSLSMPNFISNTLVDGQTQINNKKNYFLGVISFFLAIKPTILLDKNNTSSVEIKNLQNNISKILDGNPPAYITRQELMSKEVLTQIRNSFKRVK